MWGLEMEKIMLSKHLTVARILSLVPKLVALVDEVIDAARDGRLDVSEFTSIGRKLFLIVEPFIPNRK